MSASKARKIVELYRAIEARDEEIARLRDGPWIGECQACGHQHEARRPQPLHDQAALDAAVEQANARQNAAWRLMCEKMVAAERERWCDLLRECEQSLSDMTGPYWPARVEVLRRVQAALRA